MGTSAKPNLLEARHRARIVHSVLNITRPEDIVLEDIAMARGVYVSEGRLDGAEARLLRQGARGLIRVKADLPEEGRKRFAVAHELGHWELHSEMSQWTLCEADDVAAYASSPPEIEANAFAGELLMPTMLVRPRCEEATPDLAVVRALAAEFRTSLTAAALRFVEECRETCAVVFSETRKVRWWRAREGSVVWIDKELEIDRRSQAWEPGADSKMEAVAANAWFPGREAKVKREVYEQSMVLGRYETVLTLLWVIDHDDEEPEDLDGDR